MHEGFPVRRKRPDPAAVCPVVARDSRHVAWSSPSDRELWTYVAQNAFVIVSKDADVAYWVMDAKIAAVGRPLAVWLSPKTSRRIMNDYSPIPLDYAAPMERPKRQRGFHVLIAILGCMLGIATIQVIIDFKRGTFWRWETNLRALVAAASLCALVIGLFKPRTRVWGKVGLLLLCVLPAPILAAVLVENERIREMREARDWFRSEFATQIPASVPGLEIETINLSRFNDHSTLRFKIAKPDLDRIMTACHFNQVPKGALYTPPGSFRICQLLRGGDDDEFYQLRSAPDEVSTLRVNKDHTAAQLCHDTGF